MNNILDVINKQRNYFQNGNTFNVKNRIEFLDKLYNVIRNNTTLIYNALQLDLGKNEDEAYTCEIGLLLNEISYIKNNLLNWTKPKKVKTPLSSWPSKGYIQYSPYGVVLIIVPWNYPFLLSLQPLIGAIAAGNCAVVKPSELSPNCSEVISKIINEVFSEEYVSVIIGDKSVVDELLKYKFDYLFYTGNSVVASSIMQKISKYLTPVTLELGGKSPCIIDSSADLRLAARRIIFGKLLNAGQTCVAPDYIIVTKDVKQKLINYLILEINSQYGDNILFNNNFGKIINQRHFDRLLNLIDTQKVVYGGKFSAEFLKIEPTIMDNVAENDKVMQEEIFGPILPILTVENIYDAKKIIAKFPEPLALYVFSNTKDVINYFINTISFGGGCINDTIMHLASDYLPFGGVGNSGMGNYHGKHSFYTFSHEKSISKSKTFLDIPIRYQPYSTLKRWMIRLFLK